jgi:hypothetical protein
MKSGSTQIQRAKHAPQAPAGKWSSEAGPPDIEGQTEIIDGAAMLAEASSRRMEAVQAHPLAELLACPETTGKLLDGSSLCLNFDSGETVFRQNGICRGLYVVVSGQFLRKTERLEMRLTLGPARAGDLVELAAVLGDGHHTYSLTAQSQGSVLLLPKESLDLAFQEYPPLRMQLLEELAREVSRAYYSCCLCRTTRARHQSTGEAVA